MCNLKTWWWHLSDIEPKTGDLLVFLLNKSFYIKIGDKIYTFFDIRFCNIKAHTHVVYIALYNALLRKHTQKSQLITPTPKPIFFFFFAAYDKNLEMMHLNIFEKQNSREFITPKNSKKIHWWDLILG